MRSANGTRRYIVTLFLIGWVDTQTNPCNKAVCISHEIYCCVSFPAFMSEWMSTKYSFSGVAYFDASHH